MTDIRDDFEKWYRDSFPKYNLYSKYDQFKEVQATTFQAATLAQQKKVEALEIQVHVLREALKVAERYVPAGAEHAFCLNALVETRNFTPTHLQV